MDTWGLFSVTPVGLALILTGIIYFVIFGKYVLPKAKEEKTKTTDPMDYFREVYNIEYSVYELVVPTSSSLIGQKLDDVETKYRIRVIANKIGNENSQIGPGTLARDTEIQSGMVLGVVAAPGHLDYFVEKYDLVKRDVMRSFVDDLSPAKAGIAEIVIAPGSKLIGQSARDLWLRKAYGLAMVALNRGGETLREGDDIRNMPFQAGDTLVVHTTWLTLERIAKDKNFVVVTTEYPQSEKLRPEKLKWAGLFFSIALGLVLFSDLRLSIALFTGAIGMILSGVIKIEEAYEAVSWKTVFLLASLIPLGLAVETSGTAKWIAEQVLVVVGDQPIWVIQTSVAILATFFTLVMSNVGATVLLVPLAVNIAIGVGASPAVFALTVAIATSNSFLIPTHQVNALIMGPGGYRVPDFMKAGGIMTVLFLVVMMFMMNLIF